MGCLSCWTLLSVCVERDFGRISGNLGIADNAYSGRKCSIANSEPGECTTHRPTFPHGHHYCRPRRQQVRRLRLCSRCRLFSFCDIRATFTPNILVIQTWSTTSRNALKISAVRFWQKKKRLYILLLICTREEKSLILHRFRNFKTIKILLTCTWKRN